MIFCIFMISLIDCVIKMCGEFKNWLFLLIVEISYLICIMSGYNGLSMGCVCV